MNLWLFGHTMTISSPIYSRVILIMLKSSLAWYVLYTTFHIQMAKRFFVTDQWRPDVTLLVTSPLARDKPVWIKHEHVSWAINLGYWKNRSFDRMEITPPTHQKTINHHITNWPSPVHTHHLLPPPTTRPHTSHTTITTHHQHHPHHPYTRIKH